VQSSRGSSSVLQLSRRWCARVQLRCRLRDVGFLQFSVVCSPAVLSRRQFNCQLLPQFKSRSSTTLSSLSLLVALVSRCAVVDGGRGVLLSSSEASRNNCLVFRSKGRSHVCVQAGLGNRDAFLPKSAISAGVDLEITFFVAYCLLCGFMRRRNGDGTSEQTNVVLCKT
jgi:hypothetical protein